MHRSAVLVLLLLVAGSVSPARGDAVRNLVLITIDTLRADHLGCNGADGVRTPNLDRLAREGVNFTRARSPVPLTLPAHASILTGNYPPTHTVRSNGEYRLPEQQLSLAEVLQDRGYRTAAFVASFVLDRRFGLDQGFDHYDDRVWSQVEELEVLETERTAEEILTAFAAWLVDIDGSTPVFAWIHLYDPHAPYEPPEPFRSQYPGDPYGGEVAYTDSIVGKIIAELQTRQRLSDTLLAVTGDHGEGLGEHGEATHSLLIYNSTLHVPMMLWAPGAVAAGRVVDDLVRVIDLAPTLLDYLELQDSLGEGISLRARVEAGPDTLERQALNLTAYSESFYPELALGWSPLRGLETADYRLILGTQPRLFYLEEDPGETLDRTDTEPATYQRLKRQLAESIRSLESGASTTETPSLDAASRERLQSLGYLTSHRSPSSRRGPPPDPNENTALWDRIQLGIAQVGGRDYRQAIKTLESVLAEDPDIPLVYEYLGTCWRKLSGDTEAERVYRLALSRGLESPRFRDELGRILLERGEIEQAERQLQLAVSLDPQSVVIHYDLGNLYRKKGDLSRAVEHYEAALEVNENYIWAWNGLGMSLAALDEIPRASEAFRRVVEIDPHWAAGYFNLAVHLERSQMGPQALQAYERFLELSEDEDLETQRRLARAAVERLSG